MKLDNKRLVICAVLLLSLAIFSFVEFKKPVIYLIGDSTVANGWGNYLCRYIDTVKIGIQNRAVSGTSSRTYLTKGVHDSGMLANGMWDSIMKQLKKGDYVMMQFGHNDDAPLIDSARSRGSIKGIGEDTIIVYNRFLNRRETVHSYGWYLAKFIRDVQSRGATAIVCSPIPKDKWIGNKVVRANNDYGKWGAAIAARTGAYFLDLNSLIADRYDKEGSAQVAMKYFVSDHIHTTAAGALLNAGFVAKGLGQLKDVKLYEYIK